MWNLRKFNDVFKSPLTEEQRKEIIDLYKKKFTVKSIGEKFNRDNTTILYHLKRSSVWVRGQAGRPLGSQKETKKEPTEMEQINIALEHKVSLPQEPSYKIHALTYLQKHPSDRYFKWLFKSRKR